MKRLILCSALALLFSPTPGRANLDDSLAKCEERYGPPLPGQDRPDPNAVGDVLLFFKKNGYLIRVILVRGYVGEEIFAKADNSPLTDKEKLAYMANEAHGWAWAKNTAAGGENWLRSDGAVAAYIPAQNVMVLETARYQAAVAAKRANQP